MRSIKRNWWNLCRQPAKTARFDGKPDRKICASRIGATFQKRNFCSRKCSNSSIKPVAISVAKVKPRTERTRGDFHWNSIDAAQLTVPEVNEVYELLQKIVKVVRGAKARVAGLGPQAPVDSNYMLAIDVEPLAEGVLPLPIMQCIGSTAETAPTLSRNSDSEVVLTARERDVALRLAAGSSRIDVSRQLGISPHTVTEFTRRIYRKLGVNNRARLAAKLASGT